MVIHFYMKINIDVYKVLSIHYKIHYTKKLFLKFSQFCKKCPMKTYRRKYVQFNKKLKNKTIKNRSIQPIY